MYVASHFLIFGVAICLVDIALFRIYRAVVLLATLSIAPSLTLREFVFAVTGSALVFMLFARRPGLIGLGDLLVAPLAISYAFLGVGRNIFVSGLSLLLLVRSLLNRGHVVGESSSRFAAAPLILLIAIMFSEKSSFSAIIA